MTAGVDGPTSPDPVPTQRQTPDPAVADVAERLMAEFAGQFGVDVISAVVLQAARDLAGTAAGPWDERLERSARQRLLDRDGYPSSP